MDAYGSTDPSAGGGDLDSADCNDMQSMMLKKACELFGVCDVEKKGFITKRDMQRLQTEIPLSADQLEDVFDSLDDDGNGYLTLEEFTEGFGSFLGVTSPSAIEKQRSLEQQQQHQLDSHVSVENVYENERHDDVINDDESIHRILEDIPTTQETGIDVDSVKTLWTKLRSDHPELLDNFESFLHTMSKELKRAHTDYRSLETALRNKNVVHDEEMRKLYEEMETQINSEKQRLIAGERAKERLLKEEMENELKDKDKQLNELLAHHKQLEDKLSGLNSQEVETKQENEKLQKSKDDLEESLIESQRLLDESRAYINQLRSQQKEEKRERALAALHVTEGIALERESLVKQLDLLRNMNRKLRDERDEADLKRLSGSLQQELGEYGELAPSISRVPSVNASVRDGYSTQNSICSTPGVTPAAAMSEGPGLMTGSFSSDQDSASLRRNPLNKQGSILSNYVSDSSWRPPNYESDIEFDEDGDGVELEEVTHGDEFTSGVYGRAVRRNNQHTSGDQEDVGYSGMDSEEDDVDKGRPGRKTRRLAREQPVGANSSSEFTEQKMSPQEVDAATPERVFKVVFVGDSSVGKSTFIHRFCSNEFKVAFQATIGVDFQMKNLRVDDHIIALQLWDTAGQERFRSITKQYFRKADGVIVMYDVTSEASFRSIRNWMSNVQEGTEEGTIILLLGNKLDLVDDENPQAVTTKNGNRLADEYRALFYETSAKSGVEVVESIEAMARLLCEREDKQIEKALQLSETAARKKGCCN